MAPIVSNPAGASAAALDPDDTDVKREPLSEDAEGIAEETMAPPVGPSAIVTGAGIVETKDSPEVQWSIMQCWNIGFYNRQELNEAAYAPNMAIKMSKQPDKRKE